METQQISPPADVLIPVTPQRRQAGYGLPCAKCHKYFSADLEVCPICKGRERVSPVAPKVSLPPQVQATAEPAPDNGAMAREKKNFFKAFEAPILAAEPEIDVKEYCLDEDDSTPTLTLIEALVEPVAETVIVQQEIVDQEIAQKKEELPKALESPIYAAPLEADEPEAEELEAHESAVHEPEAHKEEHRVHQDDSKVTSTRVGNFQASVDTASGAVALQQEIAEQENTQQQVGQAEMGQKDMAQKKEEHQTAFKAPIFVAWDTVGRRPDEEQSNAINKASDVPSPQRAEVSASAVLRVDLGNLARTPDASPASTQEVSHPATQSEEFEAARLEARCENTVAIESAKSSSPNRSRRFDLVTFALGVIVLACAVLLMTLVGLRLIPHPAAVEAIHKAKPAGSIESTTTEPNANSSTAAAPQLPAASADQSAPADSSVGSQPAALATAAAPQASRLPLPPVQKPAQEQVLKLSPGLAEGNLLYRVEPDYPEEALRQRIQGQVVLDLHIGKDGAVQDVDLVSGQPVLVEAATAAVKQWRFRTHYMNGSEVEMQTRISLRFALPTS